MGEWLGRTVEIEVSNIAHGGVSVGRLDGRVVFVGDTIPGETVLARITDDAKKSFWRAETLEVLDPSEHRQPHVWSAAALERDPAERAGGAEFGHIRPAHQRELKRRVLTDALQRMAHLERDVEVEVIPGEADGTGWRTRLRLQVGQDGTTGPFAARSHRVVPVADMPLAVPELVAIAPLGERFPGAAHVDVVVPSTGNPFVLTTAQGERRPRPQRITERVGDRDFRLDVRGFWQVHRAAAATLTSAVQGAIDEQLFDPRAANLDLYGGVGLLAAAVADRFGSTTRITSVESDAQATDHAAENLAEWVGAAAVTGRVEHWIRDLAGVASPTERERLRRATVVLDPPRAGAGASVVSTLAELSPAQVVYVACDPVALARDVALFAERGYEVAALRAFDLFPHTHHLEAVATLRRP